jgi:hypothetical protein
MSRLLAAFRILSVNNWKYIFETILTLKSRYTNKNENSEV